MRKSADDRARAYEQAKYERNADRDFGEIDDISERHEVGEDEVVHQLCVNRKGGVLDDLLGPMPQSFKIRRNFPQRLLPPHQADHAAYHIADQMVDRSLLGQ